MATMASTHSLSVLTNSSVKPPLNPTTGLSTTFHERPGPTRGRFSGVYYDDYDHEGQVEREIFDPKSTSRKFAATADHASLMRLGNLSDEEFYQKLLELKNEQRKILQKCEKVYIEKHAGVSPTFQDDILDKPTPGLSNSQSYDQTYRSETLVDEDCVLTCKRSKSPIAPERCASPEYFEKDGILTRDESQIQESYMRESVTESMSKPPTGRPPVPYTAKSATMPSRSAPFSRDVARSLDDLREAALGLRKSFDDSDGDYVPDDTVSEPYRDQDKSYAKIEHMWNDFSIRDYAPRKQLERPSSATITRKEKKEKTDSWRHRLTVPEPFSMTMREEKKEKKKSKNLEEFEEMLYQKQIEEEEELKKQFKARPVPAHVYLPLYDEIHEQGEERRKTVRKSCADLLKSQEKPFSFIKREDDRKKHQLMERECNQKINNNTKTSQETFKAKPVPKKIFDPSVDDKLMEEEEYRKIRIKMRSEELLRAAALPPNMQAREQMREQMEREHKLKSKRKSRGTKSASRPRINHDVPNYDALYRQFQKELQKRKGMRESTVAEPFRLETERTSKSTQDRIRKELEREEQLKENRWPYKLSQSKVKLGQMYSSLDSLPIKSTRSADARTTKTRNQLKNLSQREIREIEEDRHRRVKEMKLRREIQERTKSFDTPRENPVEKKKKYQEANRARMEEYEKELQDMKDRVNRRPLLIQQESQVNAKNKAEKKFNATLRSVGLDEDFVHSRGSRSASVHDYTDDYDDDDDFEDTAMRNHEETYTKRHDSDRSMSPVES